MIKKEVKNMAKFKRATATVLSILTLSSCVVLSSCGENKNQDYPVKVANLTIEKEPEKIVALSDNAADILAAIGYDVKLEGRSDECTQESLNIVSSVGSKSNPDVNTIIGCKADVVFADTTLNKDIEKTLKEQNIKVVKISAADTKDELSVMYGSIGAIAGGNKTGREKAKQAFEYLFNAVDELAGQSSASSFTTCGYLYLDGAELKTFVKDSFVDTLIKATGATNVTSGTTVAQINGSIEDDGTIDIETLKRSNPTYIFCSDKATVDFLKNHSVLKNLDAVKADRLFEISYDSILRQGDSILVNIKAMCDVMYQNTNTNTLATQPTTENVVDISTVADQYGITLKEGMELKLEDENNDVMALQKRLDDLGYMTVEPTGYFGELTITAIKDFEKSNGLEETGKADFETLTKIFSTDAKKRATPARNR